MAIYRSIFGTVDLPEVTAEPFPEPEPERLTLLVPLGFRTEIESAAKRKGMSPSAWVVETLGRSLSTAA
jgi:hypothetical protein